MIAEDQDAGRDQQLRNWRMRIEESLAVDIMPRLADEVHFVEDNFGRVTKIPEAQHGRRAHQSKQRDRIGWPPANRREICFILGVVSGTVLPAGGYCSEPVLDCRRRYLPFRHAATRVAKTGSHKERNQID